MADLRAELRGDPNLRRFRMHNAFVNVLSIGVKEIIREFGAMRTAEVYEHMIMAVASLVQASTPVSEQGDVGRRLAEELQRRLTVKSHSDDHPRRWL